MTNSLYWICFFRKVNLGLGPFLVWSMAKHFWRKTLLGMMRNLREKHGSFYFGPNVPSERRPWCFVVEGHFSSALNVTSQFPTSSEFPKHFPRGHAMNSIVAEMKVRNHLQIQACFISIFLLGTKSATSHNSPPFKSLWTGELEIPKQFHTRLSILQILWPKMIR